MKTRIATMQDFKSDLIAEGLGDIRRCRSLTWIALSRYIPVVLLGRLVLENVAVPYSAIAWLGLYILTSM